MSAETDTRRRCIVQVFVDRLRAIRKSTFRTNAGRTLKVGELPTLGEADAEPAIVLLVGEDEIRWSKTHEHVGVRLPVQIQAVTRTDRGCAWQDLEDLLGDIKQAVELSDRTLGGLVPEGIERGTTQSLEREAGSTLTGLVITYFAPYPEMWGQP